MLLSIGEGPIRASEEAPEGSHHSFIENLSLALKLGCSMRLDVHPVSGEHNRYPSERREEFRYWPLHHYYGICRQFKTEKSFRLVDVCQHRIPFLYSQEALVLLLKLES
jgi:hypothetical protein